MHALQHSSVCETAHCPLGAAASSSATVPLGPQHHKRRWTREGRASHICSRAVLTIAQAYRDASPSPFGSMDQPGYSSSSSSGGTQPALLQPASPASASTMYGSPQPVKPQWISAPAIMQKVKASQDWQALQQVLDEHQQQLTYIHISAALVHFTRMQTGAGARRGPAGGYSSTYRSSIDADGQIVQSRWSPVAPSDASSAAAHITPRGARELLKQLLSLTMQQLENYDVQGIANTLHCMAVLRYYDSSLLESLLAAVQYRMDTGTPQNLANIIWACVTLGYTPDRDWMALYYDALDARIPRFKSVDIANTLWAFGRLEYNGSQYKVAADIVASLLQQAYPQLAEFTPQHLANSLWGLARLGFAPSPAWTQAFLAVSQYQMIAMLPAELCSMVWAASRLRLHPSDAWLHTAVQVSEPWLPALTPEQLSLLLVSLGSMGARPPASWLSRAMIASQAHAPDSSALVLTHTVKGIALLGGVAACNLSQAAIQEWTDSQLAQAWHLLGSVSPAPAAAAPAAGLPAAAAVAAAAAMPAAAADQQAVGAGTLQPSLPWAHAVGSQGQSSASSSQPMLTQAPLPAAALNGSGGSSSSTNGLGGLQPQAAAAGGPELQAGQQCQFTASELGQLMYSLTVMGVRPPAAWLARVCHTLEHTPRLLQSAAPSGKTMCLLLWSLMRLLDSTHSGHSTHSRQQVTEQQQPTGSSSNGVHPDAGQPQQASQQQPQPGALQEGAQVTEATARQAAQPWAHQHLHAQHPQQLQLPPAGLFPWLCDTSLRHVRKYSAGELAVVLRLLAASQQLPSGRWMASYWWRMYKLLGAGKVPPGVLIHHLSSLQALGQQPHPAWWKGVQHTARCTFHSFQPHHFSRLIQCMAHAGYQPPARWRNAFLRATYHAWASFQPAHWENMLWGFAQLKMEVPKAWMERFYDTTQTQLSQLSPTSLASLGWAVGRAPVRPHRQWATCYHAASQPHLRSLPPSKLVACVEGVSRMLWVPSQDWLSAAAAAVKARLEQGQLQPGQQQVASLALQLLTDRWQRVEGLKAAARKEARRRRWQRRMQARTQTRLLAQQRWLARRAGKSQAALEDGSGAGPDADGAAAPAAAAVAAALPAASGDVAVESGAPGYTQGSSNGSSNGSSSSPAATHAPPAAAAAGQQPPSEGPGSNGGAAQAKHVQQQQDEQQQRRQPPAQGGDGAVTRDVLMAAAGRSS